MNRNKEPLRDENSVLRACMVVDKISKLLKLSQADMDAMYQQDVFSRIEHIQGDRRELLSAFAKGVHLTYTTVIFTEHCEFVYLCDGVTLSVKEVVSQPDLQRSACTCGHRWLGTGFPFSEFEKELDLWT